MSNQDKDHSGAAVRGEAVAESEPTGLPPISMSTYGTKTACELEHLRRTQRVGPDNLPRWIDNMKGSDPTIDSLIEYIVSARAADAPSEPSELAQELRTGADAAQHRFPGYAAVMRRAADALDSQPTEPTGYVRISELKKLESNRVAGVGMMVQKEGGDGWTPIYASSQPTDGGVCNG